MAKMVNIVNKKGKWAKGRRKCKLEVGSDGEKHRHN